MAGIALAYSRQLGGAGTWNIVFEQFTSAELPRQYSNSIKWERTGAGSLALSGPRYRQKYIWTVDCIVSASQALELDQMYQAWDYDRAFGLSVACGLIDRTFGPELNLAAAFSVPPTYTYATGNTIVSFGLQEV